MRKGKNPNKDKRIDKISFLHQVIIPVYIPHLKDYFEESFKILKTCLQSLINTTHDRTLITVVSNGSCSAVEEYLKQLFIENKIQEIVITSNIGKYNSILKGLAGHNLDLVTIADSDVLFKENWQKETYKVFKNFSSTGVVGLIPQFLAYQNYSENTLFDHFFSGRIRFGEVEEPGAMAQYYTSLGWKNDYPQERLKYNLYLTKNKFRALVGAGHVVATYRRDLLNNLELFNAFKMGGDSEEKLDKVAPEHGYYRLTTSSNFAYHLGNTDNRENLEGELSRPSLKTNKYPIFPPTKIVQKRQKYLFKRKIIQLFLKSHKLRMIYLSYLGLPKNSRKAF